MPSRRTLLTLEPTRDKILSAARDMASRQPFEKIQMQGIAVRAGVSRATLYRYYTTKQQVYADVTVRWGLGFYDRLAQSRRQPKDARRRVHWVLKAIIDEAESERHLIRAFLICVSQGNISADHELSEISQLMPLLLSLALEVPVYKVPVRAVRLLQHVMLSGLMSLQRQALDKPTVMADLRFVADLLLFPDG
jgi:AcrR family transcriptional regulator